MNIERMTLEQFLIECLEGAKTPGTVLKHEATVSVATESESTNVEVRFATSEAATASINVSLLLTRLEASTVVGAIELIGTPETQLVILGSRSAHSYKILIKL